MTDIPFTAVGGFCVGNAQDYGAMTGVTALVFDGGNTCGIDISGGGPAARESYLFTPLAARKSVDALLLSGGSAYGLAAAAGAMRWLEERGRGYRVGSLVVPIVPQSCIFDLSIGSATVRPGEQMGYDACEDSRRNEARSGSVGGGTGATIGKVCGMARSQKSGIGYHAVQEGALRIGAVVIVNALGDVFDWRTGTKIGGMTDEGRTAFRSAEDALCGHAAVPPPGMNTTIGAIVTNGAFSQQELCTLAAMTRAALARSISPVATSADGDTIYAVSTGSVPANLDAAGAIACRVLSDAITDAVKSSAMDDAAYRALLCS